MANFQGTNENELKSFYSGPSKPTNKLVSLGLIKETEPEPVGLDKVFSTQKKAATLESDEGLTGFVSETKESLGERATNIGDILKRSNEQTAKAIQEEGVIGGVKEAFKSTIPGQIMSITQDKDIPILQLGGQVVSGGVDIIWEGLENIIQEFTPEVAEQKLEDVVSSIGNTKIVKKLAESYNNFKEANPEKARNLEGVVNISQIIPIQKGAKLTGEIAEKGVKSGKQRLDEFGNIIEEGVETLKQVPSKIAGDTPGSIGQKIAGIDEATAKVLSETKTVDFDRYLQFAQDAKANIKASTPLAKAGDRATEALELIKKAKSLAGANKSDILKKVETQTIKTQPILDDFTRFIDDRFNLKLDNNLNIVPVKGKTATISDSSIKELQSLSDELLELFTKDNVTLGNLDATVDRLQDAINFNQINRGVGGSASKTESQISSFIGKSINKRLKDVAGDDFIDANNEFRRLLELQTKLNKALGDEGVRGEGLMKSVFSPLTGEKSKRIFRDIEEEFGIDLINEAGLAKFAMQVVGDTRQANLLEALDLGPGFSNLQSNNIAKILDFIGKKTFSPERVGRGLTTK